MAVEIKETEHGTWLVNGVEVYEDINGKYIAKGLLVESESKAFLNYIKTKSAEKKNNSKKKLFGLECLKSQLKKVDDTIEKIKKQRKILDSKENLFSDESLTLRKYYENKLQQYQQMRNTIINNISVTFKTVTAH